MVWLQRMCMFREKKKYEAQIEKVVQMVQKKDREIASLKQVRLDVKQIELLYKLYWHGSCGCVFSVLQDNQVSG